MKKSTKKLVLLALMVAQALVLSIIEAWIPLPVNLPGVKLGLANIITLVAIIFLDFKSALAVVVLRTFLASVFGGGPIVFIFSAAGGILSTVVMAVLYKRFRRTFSITGVSIAGAIAHNMGQLLAAGIVMKEAAVIFYLPLLMAAAIVTGILVGICTNLLAEALKKTRIFD